MVIFYQLLSTISQYLVYLRRCHSTKVLDQILAQEVHQPLDVLAFPQTSEMLQSTSNSFGVKIF